MGGRKERQGVVHDQVQVVATLSLLPHEIGFFFLSQLQGLPHQKKPLKMDLPCLLAVLLTCGRLGRKRTSVNVNGGGFFATRLNLNPGKISSKRKGERKKSLRAAFQRVPRLCEWVCGCMSSG